MASDQHKFKITGGNVPAEIEAERVNDAVEITLTIGGITIWGTVLPQDARDIGVTLVNAAKMGGVRLEPD
jgi:hypothetical protein